MPKSILYSKYSKHTKHTLNYVAYLAEQSELFGFAGNLELGDVQKQICSDGMSIKWHQIYSLEQDDAARLSIDRDYFKDLLVIKKNDIAKMYNIRPNNLQLVASYHPKDYHPHLHFIFWSTDKREGFIKTTSKNRSTVFAKKSRELKGLFTNHIFREDLEKTKQKKSEVRNELNEKLEKSLQDLSKGRTAPKKEWTQRLTVLGKEIQNLPGKKTYGFMPKPIKEEINALFFEMVTQTPVLDELYNESRNCHRLLIDSYVDSEITMAQKMEKWKKEFFAPGKGDDTKRHNLIIKKALDLSSGKEKNGKRYSLTTTKHKSNYTSYKEKTTTAYVSSLLYHLGKTLQEDNNRAYNQGQEPAKAKRLRRKKQKEQHLDI